MRILTELSGNRQLTGIGQTMGTVDFMAPEQAIDFKNADARSDIDWLGVTLWYLLTGWVLYQRESVISRLLTHRESPIPPLSDVCPGIPISVERIVLKMVAKSPDDRLQRMEQLLNKLTRYDTVVLKPVTHPFHLGGASSGASSDTRIPLRISGLFIFSRLRRLIWRRLGQMASLQSLDLSYSNLRTEDISALTQLEACVSWCSAAPMSP